MSLAIVTSKGQVVIPSKIRQAMHIQKGTKLYIERKKDSLIFKPATPEYFEKIAGVLKTKGKLSKAILKERAKEKERESK